MTIPVLLLAVHFVADFLLQSDWMALNKSKRWDALALHVTVYSACFLPWGWPFALGVWITHFITDAITSRITSRLWFIDLYPRADHSPNYYGAYPLYARVDSGKRHWFFVVIGADQLIHYGTLAWLLTLTR